MTTSIQRMNAFEMAVEAATGHTISDLRNVSIDEQRKCVEAKLGHSLTFISRFPFIGRGNVLRDRTISHAEVERLLDEALR